MPWGAVGMDTLQRYDAIVDQLVAELKATYGPRLVSCVVYGSVGRRTPREDSDVDVLVVVRHLPPDRGRRIDDLLEITARLDPVLRAGRSKDTPTYLSAILKTPEEVEAGSPLFLDMVEDARLLYDVGGFFAGYLARLRARLDELGARRQWVGDTWYWDLKPDYQPGEVFDIF
jgi:predicted nucleotidyltransferase